MAITTSYSWISGTNSFLNDAFTAGNQFDPAVASNSAGDRYFAAWSDPANSDQVDGRVVDADDIPLTGEFIVNNTANAGTSQSDPSVAGLTGGNFVVTYTDFAARRRHPRAAVHLERHPARERLRNRRQRRCNDESSVSALSGGGFVVTYMRNVTDIRARVFDQNGNDLSGLITVDLSASGQTASSVAGLSSGGFVVVWQDNAATRSTSAASRATAPRSTRTAC